MNNFSFWKYADAPYDMISKEFAGNRAFQKSSIKVLIIAWILLSFILTTFIILIAVIVFLVFFLSNKKNSKYKSVLLYWMDYAIMKQLETTWKIHLSEDFKFRLLRKEFIQDEFSIHLEQNPTPQSYSREQEIETKPITKTQNTDFDFNRPEKLGINQAKLKTSKENKNNNSRKSVFDDYVSVRESFKKIKNR